MPIPAARSFTAESLREIAFPLGGIGTGTVSLGGRGNLRDWEIFNRPGKGKNLPYSFFAIWARAQGGDPVARVLERRLLPPYGGSSGPPTSQVSGLPRFREAVFTGAYPFAELALQDERVPVAVRLRAWNPMVPMDVRTSGMPVAIFEWSVTNEGERPVDVTLVGSLLNACGYDGQAGLGNRYAPCFGRNVNRFVSERSLHGIRMESRKYAADHPQYGTMALAVVGANPTWKTRWERVGWWDDVQDFWDDLCADGRLAEGPEDGGETPEGQTDVGSIGLCLSLGAGQSATVPFLIAWWFPNLTNYWNGEPAVRGKRLGNKYALEWPDVWEVAREAAERLTGLREATERYTEALHGSTLPEEVLDAASANASIVRTTTCLLTEDGRFHAFEGCGDNGGCCPMNCTHVWNYVQTVAFLYPELERSVRRTDFLHNTRPDGDMAFRTLLPLVGELWAFKPAADGQMGTVMKVYREWLQSGDTDFLREVWPGVRRALEFAWRPGGWDADQDGVMEGEQHNTYDIEFYGPNTMMGTLYLGALRAAEEMARALGHEDFAARCREVFDRGTQGHAVLWNGEYFEQHVRQDIWEEGRKAYSRDTHPDWMLDDTEPRYQYGPGCLSDHLLGQWFARVVGLGDLLPSEQVRAALESICRYNFRNDLTTHASVQRVYALNEEGGLLLCSWPRGGRPRYPFPYADEVWTGIEYQVAAHCIYEGLVEEGLRIVRAVRARHAGFNRNPWNEFECGHHYARAMSSWSLVLALSGCHYDGTKGLLRFGPVLRAENFRCLYTAGTGWGVYTQRVGSEFEAELRADWGEVVLRSLELRDLKLAARVVLDGQSVPFDAHAGSVQFANPVILRAGSRLTIAGE